MVFHLGFYCWASDPRHSTNGHALHGAASFEPATPYAWFGWIGVEVFFVISGLVIANSAAGASSGRFLKSRALRLLPAAWICASITLLVRALAGSDGLGALLRPYLASLTLFPAGPWIDGAYWTLAVELTFYALVFGLLLFRAFRFLPVMAWALLLANAAFLLLKATGLSWHAPAWRFIVQASEPLLLRHGAFFAIGVWLWMWSERRLGRIGAVGLALAAPVAWLEIWMRGVDLHSEAPASIGQPLLLPIVIWTILVALMALVVRRPALFTPRSAAVRSGLRRIGLGTYPLYLVHSVVGATFIRILVIGGAPKWVALGLAGLFVVGLAFVVALVFEPQVRRMLRGAIERMVLWRGAPRPEAVGSAT